MTRIDSKGDLVNAPSGQNPCALGISKDALSTPSKEFKCVRKTRNQKDICQYWNSAKGCPSPCKEQKVHCCPVRKKGGVA